MKKAIRRYLIIIISMTMFVVMCINFLLRINSAKDDMVREADVAIKQIGKLLSENESDIADMMASLKENYIIRAKAAAYIIENSAETIDDVDELRKIAELLQVDEIHLFNDQGVIYFGTHPEYYDYSVESGEQIGYFKAMLEDKNLSLCQEVQPNTAEGKQMMYAMVWCDDGERMVQIGISPSRLLEAMEKNELKHIFSQMLFAEGATMYAIDKETGTILGSTNESYIDKNISDIGLAVLSDFADYGGFSETVDGVKSYCVFRSFGSYYLGMSKENSVVYEDVMFSMRLVICYLSFAAFVMIFAIIRRLDKDVLSNIHKLKNDLDKISKGKLDTKVHLETFPEFISLSDNVNNMVESLVGNFSKMSQILDVVDVMMGIYEYNENSDKVSATKKVRLLLGATEEETRRLFADKDIFAAHLEKIYKNPVEGKSNVYKLEAEYDCYIKIIEFTNKNETFGVIMDVTEAFVEKQKLQRERDYDLLTELLGRRAFYESMDELFENPHKLGKAAVMMFDLDGLKGINDKYGHVNGDKAIREAADILKSIEAPDRLIARLSGDEFAVCIYGEDSEENIEEYIRRLHKRMSKSFIDVMNKQVPIRLSGGYTFYQGQGNDYKSMLKMADEALYESKRNGRNKFTKYTAGTSNKPSLS